MLYTALALLTVLASAYSQQSSIIEVPMTVANGNQYAIRFLASTPLGTVTREFCISNAESLGITPLTEASLPACQEPVAQHIQDYVRAAMAAEPATQQVVSVQLEVDGSQYRLNFNPTPESILAVSRDFCIQNAAALKIQPLTEESLPGCQNPVVEYMRAAAIQALQGETSKPTPAAAPVAPTAIKAVLNIAGAQVQFEVLPTEESILSVSRNFCIRNQEALGIQPLTEQSLPGCQQPVVDALVSAIRRDAAQQQQTQQQQAQMVEVRVPVGENVYAVRFRPAVESVALVARDFCISNAATLGYEQLTEENLPSCQQPIAQYLQAQLQAATAK